MNIMKIKNKKERRVINIPKEDYNTIKEHCNLKALNMSKWIVKVILQQIDIENSELLNKTETKINV
jgi:hypothetical protein